MNSSASRSCMHAFVLIKVMCDLTCQISRLNPEYHSSETGTLLSPTSGLGGARKREGEGRRGGGSSSSSFAVALRNVETSFVAFSAAAAAAQPQQPPHSDLQMAVAQSSSSRTIIRLPSPPFPSPSNAILGLVTPIIL